MRFELSEEQEELRRSARRFLAACSSAADVRAAMESDAGHAPDVWRRMTRELGWTAIIVPEEHGGLGSGDVELAVILEEMGRHLACAPFFSTACLGTMALLAAGTEEQKREHLPAIAEGELTATLAHTEESGRWDAGGVATTYARQGGDFVITGQKTYVVDGHTADLLIVSARASDIEASARAAISSDLALFAIPAHTPGISRRRLHTMDQTRRLAEITLAGVRVPASALMSEPADLSAILDRAAIALAAEQLGGAQACLDMAVEYAKVREQFGRPIGSFQAIKHACADMLVQVESARSAVYYAAWAASAGDPEVPLLAPAVKAYASDAFVRCAGESIQIHGGIGFTWEHDAHLYFKRARSSALLLGPPAHHREELARRLGLGAGVDPLAT